MKAIRKNDTSGRILAGLLIWTGTTLSLGWLIMAVEAKLPEPDTILYGNVRHDVASNPTNLTAVFKGQFILKATVDGTTVAEYALSTTSSTYVLRVPMDDGMAPQLPQTAREEDQVKFVVRNTAEGTEHPLLDALGRQVKTELNAERGLVRLFDLSFRENVSPGDSDLDGLPDSWESQFTLVAVGVADAHLDGDGDTKSNLEEFIQGTNPDSTNSVFTCEIQTITPIEEIISISFSPVTAGRIYTIFCAPNVTGPFLPIAQIESFIDQPSLSSDQNIGDSTNNFYKVGVELK